MSRKGNCWDNAVAESFFKSIKYEKINPLNFKTTDQLVSEVNRYVNWYNTKRIHSALGYLTPLEKYLQLNKKSVINVA